MRAKYPESSLADLYDPLTMVADLLKLTNSRIFVSVIETLRKNKGPVLSLIFLTVLAGFFRYYQLGHLPLGIYSDEAMNGNDGLHALSSGAWNVFYPSSGGVEGLFINLQAVSIWLFGATPWALRAVSALMGVLTVLGLYVLVRDLYGERRALIAGVLQAVLIWPVVVSRFGVRANMAVAVLVWMLWATLRAYGLTHERTSILRRFGKGWAILAGALLGIGLNTYLAFRVVPLMVVAIALLARREHKQSVGWRSLAIFITALVFALPLAIYFAIHPEWIVSHSHQVSVFGQPRPILSIGYNIVRALAMFFFSGDKNWRHNYSGSAMICWIAAPFFAWGAWSVLRGSWRDLRNSGSRNWRDLFLLSWLALGTLPGILGESYTFPHSLRLILIAPAASLLAAIGFQKMESWIETRSRARRLATAITIIFLTSIAIYNFDLYFRQYATAPGMHDAFNYRQYQFAAMLESTVSAKRRYVVVPKGLPRILGVPVDAQIIAFLTLTLDPDAQERKNIHYAYVGDVVTTDSVEVILVPSN